MNPPTADGRHPKNSGRTSADLTLDDDVRARRDERIVARLEQLRNLVADLEARLPGWRRELEGLLAGLRRG
jgi:hypothetical protein